MNATLCLCILVVKYLYCVLADSGSFSLASPCAAAMSTHVLIPQELERNMVLMVQPQLVL